MSSAQASSSDVPVATIASNPETAETTTSPASNMMSLSSALVAGLGAGVVFLMLELLASSFGAGTPMGPARATIKDVIGLSPGQYTTGGLLGTLGVHFGLALLTTVVLARIVHAWKTYVAVILGGAFGGFLYTANVVLTWTIAAGVTIGGNLSLIANYVIFGATAAAIYKYWQHRNDA